MNSEDILFFGLVTWLPILVSVIMFRKEPLDRPFVATFALAVVGSSLAFVAASLVLIVAGVGDLGMFDGVIEFVLSVPIALVAGLTIRAKRARQVSSFSRVQ